LPTCGDNEFENVFFDVRPADWDKKFTDQDLFAERSPQELDDSGIVYPLKWPLSLIVNEPRLRRYNKVFIFLAKMQWISLAARVRSFDQESRV